MMQRRGDFDWFLKGLICIAVVLVLTTFCMGGELHEPKALLSFIGSVDPQNKLGTQWKDLAQNPCLHKSIGIKCNLQGTSIVEIRLENFNLSGVIDADSLCKLQNLQVLSLSGNLIHGTIPSSISSCTRLRYLNLSSNALSGKVPSTLTKLKYLNSLDISNNHFTPISPRIKPEFKNGYKFSKESVSSQIDGHEVKAAGEGENVAPASPPLNNSSGDKFRSNKILFTLLFLVLGMMFFLLFLYFLTRRADKRKKEKAILKALKESPLKLPSINPAEEVKPEDKQELVFFVEEHESFKLEDLLDASADIRSQNLCSSLYKVILKNNATYAVKRMKKLQVSFEEFGQIMRQIGNLKHRNILPLVGYNSTNEEKLLFYKYQSNGSLLNLLEGYIEGKRDFPWRLRLTIASGIARGLAFIYQSSNDHHHEAIPHGNLKLSNIMLGKTVEKTGVDLPKWVRSMVREEWTGEVFDKEVSRAALQWAFPLLNVALKCVSQSPQDRPTTSEVLEKIDEALFAHEDRSVSSISSWESGHPDCCILHSVIPETWDTPGSNY
ncbi:hypothetical protein COLO4_09779 [Corchorus olitorius]|uniref:Protein kinase domain-containing protein n=1 Tax=Corchorus olitorius TaxID=93759 RepID=A0A1R3KAZ1_9ROSI|nr:hypothetical protein COLO4_09779 [Corchorus olitorius]